MFEWRDYLALADDLVERPDEAAQRSAISRAYYAAYHAAAAFVRNAGLLTRGHTHHRVWNVLANDPDPARAEVGWLGDLLRLARISADYHTPFPGDVLGQARAVVRDARLLVEAIERLS